MSAYQISYNLKLLQNYYYPIEKYSKPPTTQSEIGWNWAPKEKWTPFGKDYARPDQMIGTYTIDNFKYGRGKGDVFKWWGGSPDSLRIKKKSPPGK